MRLTISAQNVRDNLAEETTEHVFDLMRVCDAGVLMGLLTRDNVAVVTLAREELKRRGIRPVATGRTTP